MTKNTQKRTSPPNQHIKIFLVTKTDKYCIVDFSGTPSTGCCSHTGDRPRECTAASYDDGRIAGSESSSPSGQ